MLSPAQCLLLLVDKYKNKIDICQPGIMEKGFDGSGASSGIYLKSVGAYAKTMGGSSGVREARQELIAIEKFRP
jgi:hypothetical protein